VLLGFFAALLLVIFSGDTHSLIPLYAIGVFIAFTLSQAGMVKHWIKYKGEGWRKSILINGVGTITTAVVLVIIAVEKFTHGAWIVLVAIPSLVILMMKIHNHYASVAEQLSVTSCEVKQPDFKHHSVIIPISGVQQAVISAVKYAKAISDDVVALYVCLDPTVTKITREQWDRQCMGVPLVILDSPYRSIKDPILDYIDEVQQRYKDGVITMILPEFVPSKWWHHLLHNQTAFFIKGMLLFKKGVVSTSVPFHLSK
jgi:hypothetical protein